jgi:2-haloacid dehalogenase
VRPQALIFDVFGTLVDWRGGVARAVAEALPQAEPEGFADAWRGRYQPAMEAVRAGRRPYVALDVLHREMLDATLAGLGLDLAEPGRAALARCWERLPAWPEVPEALSRLRARRFVAPCSNASVALSIRLARFAGLEWDCVLGAEPAGAYKPDPRVYRAAAAALGLPPERVMMVAAHNDDLAAARACGLQTGFFPRPREHGPGQERDLAPTQDWDLVAEDLADLATQSA